MPRSYELFIAGASAHSIEIMDSKFTPPSEFHFDDEGNLAASWKKWKNHFQFYLTATEAEAKDEKIKTSILLTCIGEKGCKLYQSFEFTIDDDKLKLDPVLTKFEEYCNPKKNLTIIRHKLFSHKQTDDQTFNDFVADLKRMSVDCELGTLRNDLLKDLIVGGVHDNNLRERLLRTSDLDINKAIQLGVAFEESKKHTKELKKSIIKVDKITHQSQKKKGQSRSWQDKAKEETQHFYKCKYCGGSHARGKCPAYGKKGLNCNKMNHFKEVCRSKQVKTIRRRE